MKSFYAFVLTSLLVSSCGFIGENSKNIILKSNGLTTVKDYLMVDNEASDQTEFAIGSDLDYILEGVTGYSLKDDKALFGCSMTVTDQASKEVVLHYDDLFAESGNGYSKEDASVLTLKLSVGSPMTIGHSYRWNLRVWDKRGKGELTAEMNFKVIEARDLVGIKTASKGLKAVNTYILSNGSIKSTDVKIGQKLTLVFMGVDGYAIQPENKVAIGASMVVLDKAGAVMIEYSDLFANYESMPLERATTASVYLTIGEPIKPEQTYLWKVRLWDKNNQNYMESSIALNVKE